MKIKKGDKVKVIAGDDKGVVAEVVAALPRSNRVIVEGVNVVKRHTKPNNANPDGGIINKELPINVSNVKKVDDKNDVVKGAVLAVKDEEGNIVDQWTTDGTVHLIENLLPDTKYTLTELKVPEGYEKSPDITFMTDSTGKAQALQMVDKKIVIPDTSDHNRTPGWTISMIMSLLMAGLAFATRRKYGYKN